MANIFTSPNLKTDFDNFEAAIFSETNKILFGKSEFTQAKLKKIHNCIYSIALISKKIKSSAKNKYNEFVYLSEILSDSLTIPALLIQGYNSAGFILKRRISENFFHHIYYCHHPIEFELLNNGSNEYVPIAKYKDYVLSHPFFNKTPDVLIKKTVEEIYSTYQELCRIVHSKGVNYMVLASRISNIKNKEIEIQEEVANLISLFQSIIFLAVKFHYEVKFTNIEKRILSDSLTPTQRTTLFVV